MDDHQKNDSQPIDDGANDMDANDFDAFETEPQDDSEEIDPDVYEDEFSLDMLSQVYAQVLNQNRPVKDTDVEGNEKGEEKSPDTKEGTELETPKKSFTVGFEKPGMVPSVTPLEDVNDFQDAEDNASCPITPESIVEAILFVGCPLDVKLTTKKIASKLRDISPKEISKIVKQLNQRYEKEGAAYRIRLDGGHLSMVLIDSLQSFQRAVAGKDRPAQLSPAAVEVLAIVAYHQPVSKLRVEELRKRPSGGLLNQLVSRGLLATENEKSVEGVSTPEKDKSESRKLKKYVTTDRFLELMRLESLDELPQSHEMDDLDQVLSE